MFKKHPCALPDHLKEKKHNDWIWPLSKLDRSINAKGPRCGAGSDGYLPWPPRLIEGYGISRWENNFAKSIIHIPDLDNRHVSGDDVYNKTFDAYEENTGDLLKVKIKWRETSWDDIKNGSQMYSPSALQKYSNSGYIRLSPSYYARWKYVGKYARWIMGDDKVIFFRTGWRNDSKDVYYNWGPFAGLNWE